MGIILFFMKKRFLSLMLFMSLTIMANSQNWKGNASAGFGLLNTKIRLQYEMPITKQFSVGANANYYLINWKGFIVEPFARIYGKNGNEEGFFGQFKIGYGNLSTVDVLYADLYENTRSSVFGGGLGMGYKFLIGNHFTIEPYFGTRFYTTPIYEYKSSVDSWESLGNDIGSGIGWFMTTGLPIEFNWKVGYQF